jgi:hypothetical protein
VAELSRIIYLAVQKSQIQTLQRSQPGLPLGRLDGRLDLAAKGSRNEASDRCLLLLIFRHALRVPEVCRMKLD